MSQAVSQLSDTQNLAVLPHGWVWTRLEAIAEIILGQSPPSSTYNENGNGLPFYQGKLEFGDMYPIPQKWCIAPRKIAEKGDVLISVRAPVGPTNVCPERSCIGRGLAGIRGLGEIETLFMLYLMRALENFIAGKGTGTTFNAITGDRLKGFAVPLPPLPEQHSIVAKIEELFTKLDAGVDALKKIKKQLKRYRQAVLRDAFQGKLTQEWREAHKHELEPASAVLERIQEQRRENAKAKYKELLPLDASDLAELPEGWVWTRVGLISEMIQYGTSEKARKDASGIPILRMGNIQDGKLVLEHLKYLPKDWPQLNDFILRDGDVLFNRTNSAELVGKTAVYKHYHPAALFASYLIRIRVNEEAYDPGVLSFFINSFYGRQFIASVVSQQVGQANVNGTKLALMPIPLPPLPEQHKIVEEIERCLSIADEIEKAVDQSLKQAGRLRRSILKRAFEGKLVPQDPNDEPAEKLLERIKEERARQQTEAKNTKGGKGKALDQARLLP